MTISLYEKVIKAKNIIHNTLRENPQGTVAVTCAFGRSSLVLLHMIQSTGYSLPIIFADTGYHHHQIISLMNTNVKNKDFKLFIVTPNATFNQFNAINLGDFPPQGSGLGSNHDMSACCRELKIEPITNFCKDREITVCIVGQRAIKNRPCGDETHFQIPKEISTISPISDFTDQEVTDYMHEYQLISLDLYNRGHQALACLPCTPMVKRKWKNPLRKNNLKSNLVQDDDARIKRRLRDLGYM